jgi:hypothetical protein
LRGNLKHGLKQLRADYKNFGVDGAAIQERLYSCVLFGKDAKLIAWTKALTHNDISDVQTKLSEGQPDERVVWE